MKLMEKSHPNRVLPKARKLFIRHFDTQKNPIELGEYGAIYIPN